MPQVMQSSAYLDIAYIFKRIKKKKKAVKMVRMSLLIKHCMEYGKSLITDNSLSVEPPETCSKRLKSRAQSQGL